MLVGFGYIPLPHKKATQPCFFTHILSTYLERTRDLGHELSSLRTDLSWKNRPEFPCSAIARKAAHTISSPGVGPAAS